ncbi:MAG: hypothetical protein KAJ33_05945, partial [Thermoplasmata archaeon]|nr:hypothetical protein [Thermoplasmata archaeon]
MKLRTYLVKRTIHMMITLLIVLVLLFVLYRMMPGNAAAQMMMNPMMTENEINLVLVRYGFGRWVDYPGEYKVTNYQPSDIGTYNVMVTATGDDDQTDSFETQFDVNAPEGVDLIAPQILDIGLLSTPTIGDGLELYLMVHDEGSLRGAEVTMTAPNHVVVDDEVVQYTESFDLSPIANMTDEANKIYYYTGTTSDLVLGEDGSSDFQLVFEVEDRGWNMATAAMEFDTSTGLETAKLWNLSADISVSDGIYTYPEIGDSVSLYSMATGGTPTFSVLMPNLEDTDSLSMTGPSAMNEFDDNYVTTDNGLMMFQVEMNGLHAGFTFPVNSARAMPDAVDDDDSTYPLLSDLHVIAINSGTGVEIPDADYPFLLSDLKLQINATALNSDDSRCAEVIALIVRPDGTSTETSLSHP